MNVRVYCNMIADIHGRTFPLSDWCFVCVCICGYVYVAVIHSQLHTNIPSAKRRRGSSCCAIFDIKNIRHAQAAVTKQTLYVCMYVHDARTSRRGEVDTVCVCTCCMCVRACACVHVRACTVCEANSKS